MDISHLLNKEITLNIGNLAIKGRVKEITKDYVLIDSKDIEIYIDPSKINYAALEKDIIIHESKIIQ